MREFRFTFRALVKQPGFTVIEMLTIALGVGANSAIFSVVDAVMLRPLPFRNPGDVVAITDRTPQFPTLSLAPLNYADVCRTAMPSTRAAHSGTRRRISAAATNHNACWRRWCRPTCCRCSA